MDLSDYKSIDPNDLYHKGSMTFIYSRSGQLYFKPYPTTHIDMCLYDDIFSDVFEPQTELDDDKKLAIAKERNLQTKYAIMGRLAPFHGDIIVAIWNSMDHYLFIPFIKKLVKQHPQFKDASVVVVGKEGQPKLLSDLIQTNSPKKKAKTTSAVTSQSYNIGGNNYTLNDLGELRKKAHTQAWAWDQVKAVLCHPDMKKYPELEPYIPNRCNPQSTPTRMKWSDAMKTAGISYENTLYFKNWFIVECCSTHK